MMVNSNANPSITISSTNNTICAGASVTFTATAINGVLPVYDWQINGVSSGVNAASFTSNLLNNNDVVTCIYTSNNACASIAVDTSNAITISSTTPVTSSVSEYKE